MTDRDRAFEGWVAEARAVRIVDELQRRGHSGRLRRAGAELVGPCPRCGGTDRFSVHAAKNVFNCRGCAIGGDVIQLVELVDGASFLVACEILTGSPAPGHDGGEAPAEREARLARLAAAAAERARADAKRAAHQAQYKDRERVRAREIWDGAKPITGTVAERYLTLRGLTAPIGARLRFLPSHALWSGPPPEGKIVHRGPAMVAGIAGPDGGFSGIHMTWIDLAQPKGKAHVVDPATGEFVPAKKVRGSRTGGSIPLAPCPGAHVCYLGEGIETVLSVHNALRAAGAAVLGRAEFRSTVDLGNLAGRAKGRVAHPTDTTVDKRGRTRRRLVPDGVPLPADTTPVVAIGAAIEDVVMLGDGDSDPFTTRLALQRAAARLAKAYPWVRVSLAMSDEGVDFNDMWRAEAPGAAVLAPEGAAALCEAL